MTKNSLYALALLAVMSCSNAWADSEHECQGNSCNGDTITNNYNNTTTTNQGGVGFGGIGIGGSVGNVTSSATGGSAVVQTGAVQNTNNVQGGNASVGGVGNGIGNFSPSATIERGAVSNTNANTAFGGAGGKANASIESGAVRNNVSNEQSQGQIQSQTANGGSVVGSGNSTATGGSVKNSGNSSSTSNVSGSGNSSNNITFQAPKTYRPPVNTAVAPTIFPTAPCMGSSSVGGSGTLFSFSGGTSWESKECMLLETARSFDQAGFRDDALYIRCQGKYAKDAPSCKALANGTKPAVAATPATSAEVNRATEQQLEVVTTETTTQVANPVGQ